MMFKLEYRLTATDATTTLKVALVRMRRYRSVIVLDRQTGILILAATIVAICWYLVSQQKTVGGVSRQTVFGSEAEVWLAHPAIWIAACGALLYIGYVMLRRRLVKDGRADPPETIYRFTADEHGITQTNPRETVECKWEALCAFDETEDQFVIYPENPSTALLIRSITVPKRAFGSSDAVRQFSFLLRERIGSRAFSNPM